LSVRRLAKESGLSAAYLSQIENKKRPLSVKMLVRIADGLRVPPHEILAVAGLISPEHVEKAEAMAHRALHEAPELVRKARGKTTGEKYNWLVADYLYVLGEDPYGTMIEGCQPMPALDWRRLDPEAPESMLKRLKPEIEAWRAQHPEASKRPLRGWDQLTRPEQDAVQQLVDTFINSRTTGE
jgi:transcriptional regulator with XRE-family HTH domain